MGREVIKELDLHRVRHEEVDRLVENFVLLNEPPLKIITGNSDRMSNIVIVKLSELRIGWERFTWGQINILK